MLAQKEGGDTQRVTANAVIVASGGYIGNKEMVKEALGETLSANAFVPFPSKSTGEGIKMAWRVGAGKASERAMVSHGIQSGHTTSLLNALPTERTMNNLPILWVNKTGQRFCNEEIIYDSALFANSVIAQGAVAFSISDRAAVERFMSATGPYEMQFWDIFGENGGYYPAAIKTFDEDFAILESAGVAFQGNTVEELAEKAGIDPEILIETVSTYNECIHNSEDVLFFKSPKYLKFSVEKPPFYAFRGKSNFMCTVGGVRISDNFQAVTKQGEVISGLYVVGADAGGLYRGLAYNAKEGLALCFALTSGILAGQYVAKHLTKNGSDLRHPAWV